MIINYKDKAIKQEKLNLLIANP